MLGFSSQWNIQQELRNRLKEYVYFLGELLSKSMVMLDFLGTNSPRLAVGNRGTCWQFQVVVMFDQVREDHAMTKPTIVSSKHVQRWAWQSTLSTSDSCGATIETEEKPTSIWTCCCSWFLFGEWFMILCVCVEFPSRMLSFLPVDFKFGILGSGLSQFDGSFCHY